MFDKSNKINSSATIEENVTIGRNNIIEGNVLLRGPLVIGDNNYIGHGTVIGTAGEDTRDPYRDTRDLPIIIGSSCIIKENVVIHKPCYRSQTVIGDHVFLMHGTHIAHDCIVHDNVVVTPKSVLGGIVTVLKGANIALGAMIHQYSVIGHYSIVGMGACVTKNVRPFSRLIPGHARSVNHYALKKFNLSEFSEEIEDYVLNGTLPQSRTVLDIVEEYTILNIASGRSEY
jgi:UDP-N-acetylglucosamine acyltransferase